MSRRVLVVAVAICLAGCSGAPPEDATGQQIYSQLCASCHSRDLGGGVGPALGSDSAAVDLPDEVIAQIIRDGRGSGMPAFDHTLSDAQLSRLVEFIRERQAG